MRYNKIAKYYITIDNDFFIDDESTKKLNISPINLSWEITSLMPYKLKDSFDYNKITEVKKDYFYFLIAKTIAKVIYTKKEYLMLELVSTRINDLETKTITYLSSLLKDSELDYAQLELVFNRDIMDTLMSLYPPINADFYYFVKMTRFNEKSKEIMKQKLLVLLEYSFINNSSLEEISKWKKGLKILNEKS